MTRVTLLKQLQEMKLKKIINGLLYQKTIFIKSNRQRLKDSNWRINSYKVKYMS